jgi:hypothetical protein
MKKNTRRISANDEAANRAELDDGARREAASARYSDLFDKLLDEARSGSHVDVLVDNLSFIAARIAYDYGPPATGDILRRFGNYLQQIEAHCRAKGEAEQSREEGRLPH